ncbi:hypothetical protein Tco_0829411 [Tanacetum coccineum]
MIVSNLMLLLQNRLSSDQWISGIRQYRGRNSTVAVCGTVAIISSLAPNDNVEFFRKYWSLVGADFCDAGRHYFKSWYFQGGVPRLSSALNPKVHDARRMIGSGDYLLIFFMLWFGRIGEGDPWYLYFTPWLPYWVNGSPTSEFPCCYEGLKTRFPLEMSEQNLHNIVKARINGVCCFEHSFFVTWCTLGSVCPEVGLGWLGEQTPTRFILNEKVKTLSIGAELTLLKAVLGPVLFSPIYYMSIFKVPKGVLKTMESIRSKFFNGVDSSDRKISWVAWDNVLASKLNGGLGVSSFFALNRALLLKWVWRYHFLAWHLYGVFDFLRIFPVVLLSKLDKEIVVANKMRLLRPSASFRRDCVMELSAAVG